MEWGDREKIIAVMTLHKAVEKPCAISDSECLQAKFQNISDMIVPGIPELGIEPSDPMVVDNIVGKATLFKYELSNNIVTGLKLCSLKNISINENVTRLSMVYDCPSNQMEGNYAAATSIFITSSGVYVMTTDRYLVTVDAYLELVVENGTNYLQLGVVYVDAQLLGVLAMELKNKDSTSSLLMKMANGYIKSSYKYIADLTQEAVWTAIIQAHFNRINKYLITRTAAEILLPPAVS